MDRMRTKGDSNGSAYGNSKKREHSDEEENDFKSKKKSSFEDASSKIEPLELNKASKRSFSENLSDSDPESPAKKKSFSKSYVKELGNSFASVLADDLLPKKLLKTEPSHVSEVNQSQLSDSMASSYGQKAYQMMKKMGYKDGQGIGMKPGIVKPIEESVQKGKLGLGSKVKNFEEKVDSWDFENDEVSAFEKPEWLVNDDKQVPSLDELRSWKQIGQKKRILDDEDNFCSNETLKKVLECKSVFDNLDDKDMRNARFRSNPYETIGSGFFQNRAALKMANIDAVFNFIFTDPRNENGRSIIEPNEPLYFCDVCAGPGGFSEYVLWRKKWMAKGFGMTLKAENDFKLEDFIAGPAECFEPFYGKKGIYGDGDVTRTDNLKEFQRFVLSQTNERGVHFMMADGGFSVEGNENIQEILSKQLYLCQFLCALSVLRPGGNFVCKLFDIFTPFSAGLVYLMHLCFKRISIHKPVTSRPANSERYIICECALESKSIIQDYLYEINDILNKTFRNESKDEDVVSIVPLDNLVNDNEFFNYIYESNEKLGKIQVRNLRKIQAFATNKSLIDMRQSNLADECFTYWKIPDLPRSSFADDEQMPQNQGRNNPRFKKKIIAKPANCHELVYKLNNELTYMNLNFDLNSFSNLKPAELDEIALNHTFKSCSIFDCKAIISSGNLVLLLGCGRDFVYELELDSILNQNSNDINKSIQYSSNRGFKDWKKLMNYKIELPKGTLLFAEKVVEYKNNGQTALNAIHVIDAFFINNQNMIMDSNRRVYSLNEKHSKLEIFLKAINKPSRQDLCPIRLKKIYDFEDITSVVLENLEKLNPDNESLKNKYAFSIQPNVYVYPNGIYFLKYIQYPWSVILSKKTKKKYYYHALSQTSTYDLPEVSNFYSHIKHYWEHSLAWNWSNIELNEDDHAKLNHLSSSSDKLLKKESFIKFLLERL